MVGPAAGDVTAGVRGRGSLGDADEAMPSWQRCWTQGVCGASWRMHASNACSWRRSACHGWPSVMHLRVSPTRVDASDGSERDYAADARVPKIYGTTKPGQASHRPLRGVVIRMLPRYHIGQKGLRSRIVCRWARG